ncbi:DUF6082 family protein [Streptomyces cinerochromogenes]|uniref:DUF6082 family protein n=1 Tax=Streptomyces cinerochromogenes TaxID=66422 RepID=UPI0016709898|nr:DUF6082 family protein [Streptomyces cinerochromogenes]GGT05048.1 hypothetical protein GCM10010206_79190 [Streptomyces cinerochromogenes]
MKTSHALVTLAAIGVARLVQAERQGRRALVLQATRMHQTFCKDTATVPELREAWTAEDVPAEEYAKFVHANRSLAFLSAEFWVGLLTPRTLRVQARAVMELPVLRTYWERFGSFREAEAEGRTDRRFNEILDTEHRLATDKAA